MRPHNIGDGNGQGWDERCDLNSRVAAAP